MKSGNGITRCNLRLGWWCSHSQLLKAYDSTAHANFISRRNSKGLDSQWPRNVAMCPLKTTQLNLVAQLQLSYR